MFKKISILMLLSTVSIISAEFEEVECISDSQDTLRSRKCESLCCLSVSGNVNVGGTLTVGGRSINSLLVQPLFANFFNSNMNISLTNGNSFPFPTAGASSGSGIISNAKGTSFTLQKIGTYEIMWHTSLGIDNPFSSALFLNNVQIPGTVMRQNNPNRNLQLSGTAFVKTTAANSLLDLRITSTGKVLFNPTTSDAAANSNITIKLIS